jgi:hypothetical protein
VLKKVNRKKNNAVNKKFKLTKNSNLQKIQINKIFKLTKIHNFLN